MKNKDNMPQQLDELDEILFVEHQNNLKRIKKATAPSTHKAPPIQVDLSKYLHYIRKQGGHGCWGYAWLAVWDIMNEMACPYSPNLSMNLWLRFHRNRFDWEIKAEDESDPKKKTHRKTKGIFSQDGRFHKWKESEKQSWYMKSFGNATEGTELTQYPWTVWPGLKMSGWSLEGVNEAHNYRLAGEPIPIKVNSDTFISYLALGHPIRVQISKHVVAIVGYDAKKKVFKYVNSIGDRWGKNGYGEYTFNQIDKEKYVLNAEILKIVPPKPVPAVRIWFKHTNRMNVQLWLSVEDSPNPKRQIWPPMQSHDPDQSKIAGHWMPWDDNSRDLRYTVRIPSEFIWPPSKNNRLILDLFDSAAFSESGGKLIEFTAAFGGHVIKSNALLKKGPISFFSRKHRRITIP